MAFEGSFLGFIYNGIHSSELGIVRVNTGDRMEVGLAPTSADTAIDRPNADGMFYYGSNHTKKAIPIDFAFDNLTEKQLRTIKQLSNDKGLHSLVLDEIPYKKYIAKVENAPTLKYVPFEENGQRVYRGEGRLNFICYFPYAIGTMKFIEEAIFDTYFDLLADGELDEIIADGEDLNVLQELFGEVAQDALGYETDENYYDEMRVLPATRDKLEQIAANNVEEWKLSARLPSAENYGIFDSNNTLKLYNAGDFEMPITIWYDLSIDLPENIKITHNDQTISLLQIVRQSTNDQYIVIDTRDWMVYGYNSEKQKTGTVYNEFLDEAEFFHVDKGEQTIEFSVQPYKVEYNYLFL